MTRPFPASRRRAFVFPGQEARLTGMGLTGMGWFPDDPPPIRNSNCFPLELARGP